MDRFVTRTKRAWYECDDSRPTVVELFAGGGGMALGLEEAGLRHVALVEWDKHCVSSLRRNGFKNVIHRNANHVDYSDFRGVDVVAGGPPCQPFSLAGLHEGATDSRDGWPATIRAVREIRPRGFLFENVAGMARGKFRDYLDDILEQFGDLGYTVHVHVVDAADYGVPQHRKRMLMAGVRGAAPFRRPPSVGVHTTVRDMMTDLGPPNGRCGHVLHAGRRALEYKKHTPSTMDQPAKALLACSHGMGGGAALVALDDGTVRHFTNREMARLQTFPDRYTLPSTWSHANMMLGNACPPRLAARFAAELLRRIALADRSVSPSLRRGAHAPR